MNCLSKPLTQDEKVDRLKAHYGPRAEALKREMREREAEKFDRVFSEKYVHDTTSAVGRAFIGKVMLEREMTGAVRGCKVPFMTVYAIASMAFDGELWDKFYEECDKLGRTKAVRNFCRRFCRATGNVALEEGLFQLIHELMYQLMQSVKVVGTAIVPVMVASVVVQVAYMAINALQGCGFNAGKAMSNLMETVGNTGMGIAAGAIVAPIIVLPAVIAGCLIALACKIIIPAVYSNMPAKMTWKELFIGLLEVFHLKSPAPETEYSVEDELDTMLKEYANDLLCPISLNLMRHPVSLHGLVFEYEEIKRVVMETGKDCFNCNSALTEITPFPELRALIDDLVSEFAIDSVSIVGYES